MSVTNPITITYAGLTAGGASGTYQLLGPYVIERTYRSLRCVFDVIVVASSMATLQSSSNTLETEMRKRDEDLTIDLDGSSWDFVADTDYYNPVGSCSKSGDSETDRGFSRSYTCVVEAELASDIPATGLLEIRYAVNYDVSKRRMVSIEGSYTPAGGSDAIASYESNGDTVCNAFLTALSPSGTFELVEEDHDEDRLTANANFSRQYLEVIFNQTKTTLDDTDIVDHTVIFTDLSQHPADSRESIHRLRRVVGAYQCGLDIRESTDLYALFDDKVKAYVVSIFEDNYNPQVFAIEDRKIAYDETTKRLSVSLQFLYQTTDGENVVEITQSVAYREARTIDYTPTHEADELSLYADVGWATVERVWTRTAVVLGDEIPQRRIGKVASYSEVGEFDNIGSIRFAAGKGVSQDGWNIMSNNSQVSEQWIGDPSDGQTQIKLSTITETVVERLHHKPGVSTRSGG